MNCPRCQLPVEDDTFFCEHCGAPLGDKDNDIEQTMELPTVKPIVTYPTEAERVYEAKPVVRKTETKNENKTLKLRIMLTAVSFLATLVVGFGICALIMFTGDSPEPKAKTDVQEVVKTEKKEKAKKEKEKPVKIKEGSSEGEKEVSTIAIDTHFDFALGCTLASSELSYKTLKNTELGYSCAIPSSFKFVYDNEGEIRYRAEDNTAYVDVGAFVNDDNSTIDQIKSAIKEKLGGTIQREENGDGWFIMTTKSNGVIYYIKCFAGENIKYVEFVSPAQYKDVYDVFISDMEPMFKSLE